MSEFEFIRQPDIGEYKHKRATFARLQEMAVQMQRMRRAMGYLWLEGGAGGVGDLAGAEGVRLHVQQSGLILVNLTNPSARLRIDPPPRPTRLMRFHRERDTDGDVAEYVWDEAMFAERMT